MNSAPLPLITISISCYNSHDTVAAAIESALAQDWPNKEILIADDGSSDDTVRVIKNTIEGHPHVRLMVYEKNKGFAGSLNTIISEAKGEFLAIFDDDDTSDPSRVSRQYNRIINYEKTYKTDLVICHAARTQHYPHGVRRYEATMGTDEGSMAPHGTAVVDRILTGRLSRGVVGSCANCSRMARLSVFRRMAGYDANLLRAEDTDFNVRFGLAGGHFAGIAQPLVNQTMTMGQEKTLDRERTAELSLLEKHKGYLEGIGWYSFCRAWLDIRYDYLNDRKSAFFGNILKLGIKNPLKLLQKLCWAIPARSTRANFKKWHLNTEGKQQ